jgi:hypothetical protein
LKSDPAYDEGNAILPRPEFTHPSRINMVERIER